MPNQNFLRAFRLSCALGLAPAIAQAQAIAATDTPVATASGSGAPPATPQTAGQTSVQSLQEDGPAHPDVLDDRKPHGYVEVGVGNRGYRQVDGAVTVPVGEDGQATVAISDVQMNGGGRR